MISQVQMQRLAHCERLQQRAQIFTYFVAGYIESGVAELSFDEVSDVGTAQDLRPVQHLFHRES